MGPIHNYETTMIFRQLFEPLSSTYTYVIACEQTGEALLLDPVVPSLGRDLGVLAELGLRLVKTVETHLHADHITAALYLREQTSCQIGFPGVDELPCADIQVEEGVPIQVGELELQPLFTPGHTDDHFSYLLGDRVFTGDCLLIDGCGRTDFQNGDPAQLYQSITEKLFKLPDETLVYPGHDYNGRHVSSIAQERQRNPRIGGKDREQFVKIMQELELAYPVFIDYAVPHNRLCGECPSDIPAHLEQYCQQMALSPQG